MYWKMNREWYADFRDGIKIWQLPGKEAKYSCGNQRG
jgi:hypothetical protein